MKARALVVCALVLIASRSARGAPPETGPALSGPAIFREAKVLQSQGRYELACQRFADSHRTEPSVGALLNIADCQERAGKLVAAHGSCIAARDLAQTKQDAERASFAETRARELDARIPRLHLELLEPNADDLLVMIDGAPIAEKNLREPLPIDPGPHRIQAAASGRKPVTVERAIAPRERHVYISIPRFASPAPPSPSVSSTPGPPEPEYQPEPQNGGSSTRPVVIGTVVGGSALLIGGIVTGVAAIVRWNDFLKICPDRKCSSQFQRSQSAPDHDAAESYATVSTVLFASGLVLLAAGAYFNFFRGKTSAGIAPRIAPRAAGLSLSF